MTAGSTTRAGGEFVRILRLGTVAGVASSHPVGPAAGSDIPGSIALLRAASEGKETSLMPRGDARRMLASLASGEWVMFRGEDGLEARQLARWASEAHVDVWTVSENVYCRGR